MCFDLHIYKFFGGGCNSYLKTVHRNYHEILRKLTETSGFLQLMAMSTTAGIESQHSKEQPFTTA